MEFDQYGIICPFNKECRCQVADCDNYGTKLCKNMNDPEFIKWMDERNGKYDE